MGLTARAALVKLLHDLLSLGEMMLCHLHALLDQRLQLAGSLLLARPQLGQHAGVQGDLLAHKGLVELSSLLLTKLLLRERYTLLLHLAQPLQLLLIGAALRAAAC